MNRKPRKLAAIKTILAVSALLGAVELPRAVSDQTLSHENINFDAGGTEATRQDGLLIKVTRHLGANTIVATSRNAETISSLTRITTSMLKIASSNDRGLLEQAASRDVKS